MSHSRQRLAGAAALAAARAIPMAAQQSVPAAQPPEAAAIKRLAWRSIGPANPGGRVADIVGIPGNPAIFYVVPANAGIFKTINGGTTFTQIFADDNISIASVGALAIAPSDPNVLWAAAGEGDPRNFTSYGDGVYRSTETGQAVARLNAIIAGSIAEVNAALASMPHVVAAPVK